MGTPGSGPRAVLRDVPPQGAPSPADLSLDLAFRQFSRYVARIALRVLGREDEVDDVVQDVFLAAERGLRTLDSAGAIRPWLATVTVRVALRRLRRRRLRSMLGLDHAPGYMEVAATTASPADRLLVARVYAVLDRMPVRLRLAWSLRHLEGEPLERVAALCGCSLATAKRRIAAAQTILREAIDG